MKLNQFAMIFVIIAIAVIVYTDISTNNLKAVIENKEQIDRNIDTAIDDGVTSLAELDDSNNITVNKDRAINSFFLSLHASFGVLSDKDSQEKILKAILDDIKVADTKR